MSENDSTQPANDRQDPAETNRIDVAVETETQPATPDEASEAPAPTSVEVSPSDPAVQDVRVETGGTQPDEG